MPVPSMLASFNYKGPSSQSVNVQEFSSSGTWTKPPGATMISVECMGGGGGGAGGNGYTFGGASTSQSSGGGGAGYSMMLIPASLVPNTVPVTVGAGGAGGSGAIGSGSAGNNGTNGGTSSFGQILNGYGGGFGQNSSTVGAGGGVLSGASGNTLGRPSQGGTSSGSAFGGQNSTAGAGYPDGGGWGGGNGGGLSSLLGGGGGGSSGQRTASNITAGGGSGGLRGNSVPLAYVMSGQLGAAGTPGINGCGGFAGNAHCIDGARYVTAVKYSTNYVTTFYPTSNQNSFVQFNFPMAIARSTDGVSWSAVNTNVPIYAVFIGVDGNMYGVSSTSGYFSSLANSAAWDYYTSTDGQTWTYVSTLRSASSFNPIPIVVNGFYMISTSGSSTSYSYSTDLINWTAASFNTATEARSSIPSSATPGPGGETVCFCASEYISAGGSLSTNNLQYASSIGGSWTLRTTGVSGQIQNIATNGTRLVAKINTATSPYMYYSDNNGATWTIASGTLTGITTSPLIDLKYLNSTYIATQGSNIYYSTDGITWATATDGTTDIYSVVVFADAKFSVFSATNSANVCVYATTPSGAWTAATMTSYGAGGAGGAGGYPGGGGGAGGLGTTGGAGGRGGGGMVRITSW